MYPYTSLIRTLKPFTPRAKLLKMDSNRAAHLLGNGGELLKFIEKTYQVEIEILEDDYVYIYAPNYTTYFTSSTSSASLPRQHIDNYLEAVSLLRDIVMTVKEGDIYQAIVTDVKDFGVFLKLNKGQEALLHISQITYDDSLLKSKPLSELIMVGQKLSVKVSLIYIYIYTIYYVKYTDIYIFTLYIHR